LGPASPPLEKRLFSDPFGVATAKGGFKERTCPARRMIKMCEANAFLAKDGKEELIMASVDILRPEGDLVYIRDIFGEQRWVKAQIKEMNLVQHRILLEEDKTS
jgi:predicted RNA-binding protein